MKKYLLSAPFLFLFLYSHAAAPLVSEAPINGYGTPVTISISGVTPTKVPSSQTSGRFGILVNVPSGNSGVAGFYGNCTSTSLANTIRPIEISTGTNKVPYGYFPMREDVCLWLVTLGGSSEDIHYQEVKQ